MNSLLPDGAFFGVNLLKIFQRFEQATNNVFSKKNEVSSKVYSLHERS